jgi:hypothetical protein
MWEKMEKMEIRKTMRTMETMETIREACLLETSNAGVVRFPAQHRTMNKQWARKQ